MTKLFFLLNVACHRRHRHHHRRDAPGVAWREWMALAGRQAVGKRRMAAAKRWAAVTKRQAGARSVVKVAPLGPEAVQSVAKVVTLRLGAIPPMVA